MYQFNSQGEQVRENYHAAAPTNDDDKKKKKKIIARIAIGIAVASVLGLLAVWLHSRKSHHNPNMGFARGGAKKWAFSFY